MENEKIEALKAQLDSDEFWLLVRKFSVASAGLKRALAKQHILIHVTNLLCEMEKKE